MKKKEGEKPSKQYEKEKRKIKKGQRRKWRKEVPRWWYGTLVYRVGLC